MDWITELLNIIVPLLVFIILWLYLPLFQLVKFLCAILHYVKPEDVTGKVVVITGAASGIGKQLAVEYAKRRATLVLADIREEHLQEMASYCLQLGSSNAIGITADVTNADDCKRIVDSTISHFGRLDHLVCNAGILSAHMVEDYEDITKPRSVMDVNFWGSVYVTRFAIPHLRKTAGKIIVMSSAGSWFPMPRMSIYNASKAAMLAFYETLRVEVGSDIHITIATPGFIETSMTKGMHLNKKGQMKLDPDVRKVLVSVIPMGKVDECAKAIVDAACHRQRYVTRPKWYRAIYPVKLLCFETAEWFIRRFYVSEAGDPPSYTLSNKFLEPSTSKAIPSESLADTKKD